MKKKEVKFEERKFKVEYDFTMGFIACVIILLG